MNDNLDKVQRFKDLEERVINLEGRMGTNKHNLPIGSGLVEESRKTNDEIKLVKKRLEGIEREAIETNNLIKTYIKSSDNFMESYQNFLKSYDKEKKDNKQLKIIFIFILIANSFKDILSLEMIKSLIDLAKKIFF